MCTTSIPLKVLLAERKPTFEIYSLKNSRFWTAVTFDIHQSNDLKALQRKSIVRCYRTKYLPLLTKKLKNTYMEKKKSEFSFSPMTLIKKTE